MFKIQLQNKIAKIGTDKFNPKLYTLGSDIDSPDAVLVRSAALHDMSFSPVTLSIARAGAGVNNIPLERCSTEGIVVMNTPGANANGVKELTILALLLSCRDVIGGISWAATLENDVAKSVETGKSAFGGIEIAGKTLGIIGLGAIGVPVANAAVALGMEVVGCDPYISDIWKAALSPQVKIVDSFEKIFNVCDFLSLHVPATPTTKGMINHSSIALCKDGVKIINLSRADLVNSDDIKAALESGKVGKYVVDFPIESTQGVKNVISIPHLGASTEESEENCAVMAVCQTIEYLENGNIVNSVNFPNIIKEHDGKHRICILNNNSVNKTQFQTTLNSTLFDLDIEVNSLVTNVGKNSSATIVDTDSTVCELAIETIKTKLEAVRVRFIG